MENEQLNWNKKNQIRFQKFNVRCTITRRLEDDVEYFTASNLSGLNSIQLSELNIFLQDDMDKDELFKLFENLRRYGCRNEGLSVGLKYGNCKKTDKEKQPNRYKVKEVDISSINIHYFHIPPFYL